MVGVAATGDWRSIVGILGVLCSGAAYVPLDPNCPGERLAYVVENAGVEIVVAPDRESGDAFPHRIRLFDVEGY